MEEPPLPRPPWEEGEEEEEPLGPAALRLLEEADRLSDYIVDRIVRLRELLGSGRLRGSLPLWGRLPEEAGGLPPGYAVDSTFPLDGGIPLIGGHLAAAVAGYVCFGGASAGGMGCHGSHAKAWLVESEEARKLVPVQAKLLEKRVALRLLREGGGEGFKLLLLDGEVVPYQLLFKSQRSVEASPALSRLDEASHMLLEEARRRRVTIVGVVKRSYSRMLAALLGEEPPLNDKAVMTLALGAGEYAGLGSFRDLLPRFAEVLAASHGRSPEKYRLIVSERLERRPRYGDVYVAFYKPRVPRRGAYAVRVEVLDYAGMGLEAVLSALAAASNPATGLPYPIDVVDEYTRIEARALELLRRRLLARVARLLGPAEAAAVLAHTNPEKRYLYEPRGRGAGRL